MFKVHQITMLKVADINPAAYNPRKITPAKYEALKANVDGEGFLEPLVVQKKGLGLIGGHQRLRVVKELAIEAGVMPPDLPCIVLDIDDTRAKKLNVKLNSLTGEFDPRLLGELLVDLYEEPTRIPQEEAMHLGFEVEDMTKYMHIVEPPEATTPSGDDGGVPFGKSTTLSIEFDSTATRDRIKKLLKDRSEVEKKKSGDIVAQALLVPRVGKKPKKRRTKAAA